MAERKQQRSGQQSESQSLKEREYRDKQGDVHHHTRTYMEQHKGEQGGGRRSSGGEGEERRRDEEE